MTARRFMLATVIACLAAAPVATWATTPSVKTGITVTHAWVRLLPLDLPAGGYAVIINNGATPARLTGASSPAYRSVMLHQSTQSGGMSRMHMVKQLVIPPHGSVKLAPGGYHLMLMHARKPVKAGETIPLTLHFADGKTLTVDFALRPANAH